VSDYRKYLDEQLKDPEFRSAYEDARPEYEVMRAMINARLENKLTQKELSEKTGIRQSNLSRIERGTSIPNIATLHTIAKGLGKKLHIEFR
jgi:ribosome-binding protein aMBF1 (putative translation factor)